MKSTGLLVLATAISAFAASAADERVITCLIEVHDDGAVECFDEELAVTVVLENGPRLVEEGVVKDGEPALVGYDPSGVEKGGKGKGHLIDSEEMASRFVR